MTQSRKRGRAVAPRARAARRKTEQCLQIEGELTIYSVAEWHSRITAAFGSAAPHSAIIDLSRISEIDTAGVQLLLMSRRSAVAQQRSLRLVAPSPAVRELMQLCFLDDLVENAAAVGAGRAGEEAA